VTEIPFGEKGQASERPVPPAQPPPLQAPPAQAKKNPRWQVVAIVLGLSVLVYVVYSVGFTRVLETFVGAAAWMPLVMLADLGFFVFETNAYRAVLGSGAAQIPKIRFFRASLLYYCVMVLAPLGRMGAEVARATAFAPWVGGGRAMAAAGNMQAGVLIANFAISVPCWIAAALALGAGHPLSWLLLVNGVGTGLLGVLTLLLIRRSRIGAWLGASFPRLKKLGADLDGSVAASPKELWLTVLSCSTARLLQLGQYAALLAAIGAVVTVGGSLVAFGVHLVGAAFGDMVPNQVGVLEGTYRIFADAVGLGDDPARAVSIALLARISQMAMAGVFLVVLFFTRRMDQGVAVAPSLAVAIPPPQDSPREPSGAAP
jgi:hypothetical protein